MGDANRYLDLTSYSEIYRELVYQRNAAIGWLSENKLLGRNRRVKRTDVNEWNHQLSAMPFRSVFREDVLDLLDMLYSHDAIEAIYDFTNIDLGDWSDTEANWLDLEIHALQNILSKLEGRYSLQYRLRIDYKVADHTLYLNGVEVMSLGRSSIKHRLLSALYSRPDIEWQNNTIEEYFIKHFDYQEGSLKDTQIVKAGNDINTDVASKVAAKDFLKVSNSALRVNPFYLP